jgi:hypothetical protein
MRFMGAPIPVLFISGDMMALMIRASMQTRA